ncbi:Cadherin tumor suppressor [Paragonimus heterotremus]|uniref:Cadherin tumor suppressor n=1 Tax=Paragonimus heterotremus TaxID=100268 RepID=A0A8J4SUK5_9TREM|nr:Cadherin tumor suppressor [Paragonimus heterotremus]
MAEMRSKNQWSKQCFLQVCFHMLSFLTVIDCGKQCTPVAANHTRESPFWSMRALENLRYPYGYPLDFMGGIIGHFLVNHTKCTGKLSQHDALVCIYGNIPKYCHYGLAQMALVPNDGHIKCPGTFMPDLSSQPEHTNVPKNLSVMQIISLKTARELGEDLPEWKESLLESFKKCAECDGMQDIGGIYVCDYSKYLKNFEYTVSDPRVFSWDKSQQNIFALYVYYFCTVTWPTYIRNNPEKVHLTYHPFCPNPCSVRRSPCSKLANTLPAMNNPHILNSISESNCVRQNYGFYEGEYECLCRKGFVWNHEAKVCEAPDLCALNEEQQKRDSSVKPICSKRGTLRCISFHPPPTEKEKTDEFLLTGVQQVVRFSCVCRDGYMGQRCDRLRDPCIESGKPGAVSGEQACRTYLGNKCTPHNGTDYYFCKCAENWVHDPTFPFPNCYKRRTICDRVICRNRGTCVGSADQRAFLCICEYGWYGRLCELPDVRHWMPWGAWTLCSAPLCGGRGWHSRSRECRVPVSNATGLGQCEGNSLELRPCRSGCPDPVRSYVPMIKLIIFFGCCLLLLQASVGMIYVLLQMEYL